MEAINFDEATNGLVSQLESTLAKLALAAEAGVRTSELESKAQNLANKLKTSAELLHDLPIYKNVKGSEVYQWYLADKLNDSLFAKYTNLCKRCKEQLGVFNEDNLYFAKIADGLFVSLVELPQVEMPAFKVKIEGNTLMAVRSDLLAKLPANTRKMLIGEKEDEANE